MGKVCVCGASALQVDYQSRTMQVSGQTFKEGDYLSIDGTAGEVYAGQIKNAPSEILQGLLQGKAEAKKSATYQNFARLMKWCDQATRLQVRTNADNPEQTANAVAFGASGIGLCRTEHMFFEGDRIDAMREMILAEKTEDRQKALARLLPYQREDFLGMFKDYQGVDYLLHAFMLLARAHPRLRLVLVGDGPCRSQYDELIHFAGIGERVIMPGLVPHGDVVNWLEVSDVVVSPLPTPLGKKSSTN